MSEEEQEVIDYFENLDIDLNTLCRIDLKGLEKKRKQILNLIEKQQKEIEDKNQFIDELQFRYNIEHQSKIERYISKDKIREDIKKFEKLQEQTESVLQDIRYTRADLIKYLKELLKEGE